MIYDPVDVRISVSNKRQILGGGEGDAPFPWIRHCVEVQNKDIGASLQSLLTSLTSNLRYRLTRASLKSQVVYKGKMVNKKVINESWKDV